MGRCGDQVSAAIVDGEVQQGACSLRDTLKLDAVAVLVVGVMLGDWLRSVDGQPGTLQAAHDVDARADFCLRLTRRSGFHVRRGRSRA